MASTYIALPALTLTGPIVVSGPISVTQGTSPWVVSGTVAVSNFPSSFIVNQGTSPWIISGAVTGPLTDAQLRATPVAVSGTFFQSVQPVSQSGVWSVGRTWTLDSLTDSISCVQSTSPWVVSGSVSASQSGLWDVSVNNFPATQAVTQSTSPWVVSGTVAATQSGTWTTGRTWTLNSGTDSVTASVSVPGTVSVTQGTSPWIVDGSGVTQPVSGTVTANQGTSPWVVSGTVNATQSGTWNINDITGAITLPTGASTSALQTAGNASLASIDSKLTSPLTVTGPLTDTQLRATPVPVSLSSTTITGTVAVTQSTSPWVDNITQIGGASFSLGQQLATASLPVVLTAAQLSTLTPLSTVAVTQSTSPWVVSGTVTANQGGTWNIGTLTSITNALPAGSNVIGHVITDSGSVTNATLSAETTKVIGTVNQGTSPWVISGAVTGPLTDTQLRATPVPVSGTVTANAGSNLNTSALALDATLTGGTAKAIVRGGAKGSTVAADVTSTASGANHQLIDIAIYDASGNQITSFGGGTQYADGAARGTATGTLMMVDDGTNIQSAAGTTAGVLKVDLSATTANATAIATNVAQMNGVTVTMGNGVSGTGVQRVTIASDSTGVVGLATGSNTIGALTANQSVNNAQIAGVTTATGNGVVGTGVQRVAIASDNTAFGVLAQASQGTLTNRSGTATAVVSTVMSANSSRKYLLFQNTSNGIIYINFTTSATAGANDIQVAPGFSFIMENNFVSTEALTAITSVGSRTYVAKEG